MNKKKHKALDEKYDHYTCPICMKIGEKEAISEFLEGLYTILDLWCRPMNPEEMKEFRENLDQEIEKWEKRLNE